jgi:cellulose synthase operon protein C
LPDRSVPMLAPAVPPRSERDRRILVGLADRLDPADPGAHNNLGVLYFNKGMVEEAIRVFQRALELDPRMQVAQRNLEIAYFGTGYYARLIAELEARLREDPADGTARRRLARAFRSTGDHAAAARELRRLVADGPEDVRTLLELAGVEKEAGRFEAALGWLRRAERADPARAAVHFALGELFYNQGLAEDAEPALRRAVELREEYADALHLLSFVYGDLGQPERAEAAARHARELNPHLAKAETNLSLDRYNPARFGELTGRRPERPAPTGGFLARYHLGIAYRQRGLYAEALRELERGLAGGEEPDLLRQAIAELRLLRGEGAEAAGLYERLVEERGGSPKLWNELGVARQLGGDLAGAEACYLRAIEADPAYALARNNLGVARLIRGDAAGGAESLRRAVELHPGLVNAGCNRGLLAVREGRVEEAHELYRAVVERSPEAAAGWVGLGVALTEARRYAEARNACARAVEIDPGSAEARYHLGLALSRLGEHELALRETRRALELDPYFSAPRLRLAVEVQFEYAEVLAPELDAGARTDAGVGGFDAGEGEIDAALAGLRPAAETPAADPLAEARRSLAAGRFDHALALALRAAAAGADPMEAELFGAEVYLHQGLDGEALDRYDAALERVPLAPEPALAARVHLGRARALLRLGRFAAAAEAAGEAARLEPAATEAGLVLVPALLGEGRREEALRYASGLAARAPTDARVLRQLGRAAAAVGDRGSALGSLRRAVELDPHLVAAWTDMARLLLGQGRAGEAAEVCGQALAILPSYPEAMLLLAEAERLQRRPDRAIAVLVDLLTEDACHPAALLCLGRALRDDGRPDDARRALERALRFDPASAEGAFLLETLSSPRDRRRRAPAAARALAYAGA